MAQSPLRTEMRWGHTSGWQGRKVTENTTWLFLTAPSTSLSDIHGKAPSYFTSPCPNSHLSNSFSTLKPDDLWKGWNNFFIPSLKDPLPPHCTSEEIQNCWGSQNPQKSSPVHFLPYHTHFLVLSVRANPPFPMHNALIECLQMSIERGWGRWDSSALNIIRFSSLETFLRSTILLCIPSCLPHDSTESSPSRGHTALTRHKIPALW